MRTVRLTIITFTVMALATAFLLWEGPEEHMAGKPYHHLSNGRFRNPQGTNERNFSPLSMLSFMMRRLTTDMDPPHIPDGHVMPEAEALSLWKRHLNQDSLTWIGHASFLIQLGGVTVATDPLFSDRVGPLGFGPRRYVAPGIAQEKLPKIDIVVISHNHYDALDAYTLAKLPNKSEIALVVPLGVAKAVRRLGFSDVHELDWYDEIELKGVSITLTPAVHFSSRGLFDRNQSLWGGYVLASSDRRVYFSGDSAYGPIFSEIGERYGPFDVAILGIGTYLPSEIMRYAHSTPEEAVQEGLDVGAQRMVGMHWGTISLSDEPSFEPPKRFLAEAKRRELSADRAWIMSIGETRAL